MRSGKLNKDVRYHIRHEILNGHYQEGDFVKEEALSEQFSVSRTTVRTALDDLVTEGFLIGIPSVGKRVSRLNQEEFRRLIYTKKFLDFCLAGKLPRAELPVLDNADPKRKCSNFWHSLERLAEMEGYKEVASLHRQIRGRIVRYDFLYAENCGIELAAFYESVAEVLKKQIGQEEREKQLNALFSEFHVGQETYMRKLPEHGMEGKR